MKSKTLKFLSGLFYHFFFVPSENQHDFNTHDSFLLKSCWLPFLNISKKRIEETFPYPSFYLTFSYELSNGQIHSEAGGLSDADGDGEPVVVVSGAYSYVGPDGITYWVTYTADEDGYHPIVGQGPGGIKGGDTASLDPSVFKSLVG